MSTKTTNKKEQDSSAHALQESELLFRSFVQQNIDGIMLINTEGIVAEWNESMEQLSGFKAADMIGLTAWEIQFLINREESPSPERYEQVESFYRGILQTGIVPDELRPRETTLITKEGRRISAEQKIFVIKTHKGNWIGVIVRDLTERNRLEREIQNERDFALQIINALGQGLTVTDQEGNFILVNPAFANLLGYDPTELIGKGPRDISGDKDGGTLTEALQERHKGKTSSYSAVLRHKNGRRIHVLITGAPRIKMGDYIGTIASITDLSDIRRAESEREELIRELEAQNAELERYTYTVSHDLKSPLVTIKGFLGYLEDDISKGNVERLKKDMERISSAVDKMNTLLRDLLELSRIGRIINPSETVAFDELVNEAVKLVHGRLDMYQVEVHIQKDLPSVSVDRPRLVEVLQNLIDNAAKYMGKQPAPRIEIGQHGEEGGKPIFYIRDNGIGIPNEYHERIFGLFDKLDANSEGTGIGLALVKRIIELHEGRIWVESKAGNGATFYFTLPGG